jgi:hypothetical protein
LISVIQIALPLALATKSASTRLRKALAGKGLLIGELTKKVTPRRFRKQARAFLRWRSKMKM